MDLGNLSFFDISSTEIKTFQDLQNYNIIYILQAINKKNNIPK